MLFRSVSQSRYSLRAGEEKEVNFVLSKNDLSFILEDQVARTYKRVTEDGDFKLMISGYGFELEQPKFPWEAFYSRTYKGAINLYYKSN